MTYNTEKYPVISVLMAVHNCDNFLIAAVNSVYKQTFTNFEFIIIDDASTDNTASILKSFYDPRIRVIRNESNLGLTRSLNIGLAQARGEWIARMDADDVMLPHRLQTQLEKVTGTNSSVCFSRAIVQEENNNYFKWTWVEQPWDVSVWAGLFGASYGVHPSVMIKRSTMLQFGGYDEAYPKAQDYELFDRMCAAGEVFTYIPEPLLLYRRHSQQISCKKLPEQALLARQVSFRAMRRYLPDLTDEDALSLRWLFYNNESLPSAITPQLFQLATHLISKFFATGQHNKAELLVYKSAILSIAQRYDDLTSPTMKYAAWKFVFLSTLSSRQWGLPFYWLRLVRKKLLR